MAYENSTPNQIIGNCGIIFLKATDDSRSKRKDILIPNTNAKNYLFYFSFYSNLSVNIIGPSVIFSSF